MNPAFAIAEVLWLLAGADDEGFLSFWNPRMRRFLDTSSTRFHGAYGFRLGSRPTLDIRDVEELRGGSGKRIDQLHAAYEALKHTGHSRQIVLQIWDSALDFPNPTPRSNDVPCSICSHLLLRDGHLEWLQVMRSNDLVWGMPYNLFQWTCVQEIMAGWLHLELGSYNHISDSLHVYERHWQELDAASLHLTRTPENTADLRIGSYEEWSDLWSRLVRIAQRLRHAESIAQFSFLQAEIDTFPVAYQEWVAVLRAEALRRQGHEAAAFEMIGTAGAYWETSWTQWARSAGVLHPK
jgi:thymidylate synthase